MSTAEKVAERNAMVTESQALKALVEDTKVCLSYYLRMLSPKHWIQRDLSASQDRAERALRDVDELTAQLSNTQADMDVNETARRVSLPGNMW